MRDTRTHLTVETGAFTVDVDKNPLSIRASRGSTPFLRDVPPHGLFLVRDGHRVPATRASTTQHARCRVRLRLTFDDGSTATLALRTHARDTISVELEPDAPDGITKWGESLAMSRDERIYGLTERIVDDRVASEITPVAAGSLDRRGEIVTMYVTPTMAAYAPFYQSSKGYGLLVDGTMPGVYDVGKTEPDELSFEYELDPTAKAARYFLFSGASHYRINDAFSRLTGRPLLPPPVVFRHWRGHDEAAIGPPVDVRGVAMNPTVADDILSYQKYGIPAGLYHFDRPWAVGSEGIGALQFDPVRFPDPQGMLRVLRDEGWKSEVWISEWVLDDRAATARAEGWLAPGSDRELDLTNPDAVRWLRNDIRQFLTGPEGRSVDGFFLDRTDEIVPSRVEDVYHDGRTGRQIHNTYPVLFQQAVRGALDASRPGTGWLLARAAYTGTPRLAMMWGGDTPSREGLAIPELADQGKSTDLGLRSVLVSMQRAAFMGIPYWGSDIGGYSEFADREVFARWIEVGAFSPLMRFHGKGTRAPWAMPTEPHFDQQMLDIYERYVVLHHALGDYLMGLAKEAHRTGAPLVRPLAFNFPHDPKAADRWDEWQLGNDLLVAPVWQSGARSRTVYLPKGRWIDFWDRHDVINGPVELTVDVPLDRIPLYVAQGSKLLRIHAS